MIKIIWKNQMQPFPLHEDCAWCVSRSTY